MLTILAGHTNTPPNLSWVRGEIERVLTKLDPAAVTVALDVGAGYELAEAAVLCDLHVELSLLTPPHRWLRYVKGYPGLAARSTALFEHPRTTVTLDHAAESVSRATRRRRLHHLADTLRPHVLLYDERPHGTIFEAMQRTMGVADLYLINPDRKRTVRLPAEGATP